jgi:hypothetical protein
MLTAALRVLNSQWQYVEGNLYYEQAYKRGQKLWRDYYFRQALGETRVYLKSRAWGKASRSAIMPIQYILIKGKESGFKIGGLSKYWLKAAWRRLTRQPVRRLKWGDVRRLTPLGQEHAAQNGLQISDYYVHQFLKQHQSELTGRVLLLHYGAVTPQFARQNCQLEEIMLDPVRQPLLADLADLPSTPTGQYDCIIMPQLLHRVYNLPAAIDAVYGWLKPGGVLLLTAPGFNQNRRDDPSYWAFTERLVNRLLVHRFPKENVTVKAVGNVLAAAAHLHCLPANSLSAAQLNYLDVHYQLVVGARAVKSANPHGEN